MSTARRTSSSKSRATKKSPSGGAARAKVVWVSLVAAMTVVGGALVAIEGRPAPRADGLSLSPLVASGAPSTVESVFRTNQPLDRARWTGIVIHHSGSSIGSAVSIASEHEAMNLRGLGHHFIIGNGKGMVDGEITVGYRWMDQLPGAHAGGKNGDELNLHTISICLVGDGNRRSFTRQQYDRLVQLTSALCRELRIPPNRVFMHSDVAPTTDPGVLFPTADFRREISRLK